MTLYHLTRRDGTPLFIHPFYRPGSTLDIDSSTVLHGKYGAEPRVESLTLLRNELYRRIDSDVRAWISERRFIPRFLIAAGAFLVTFLFMSLVIRDPIPAIDELLIGGGVAVFVFIVVGRRFVQSEPAGKRRIMLRSKVDGVVFTESPFIREVETLLHTIEGENSTTLLEQSTKSSTDNDTRSAEIVDTLRQIKERYPDDTSEFMSGLRQIAGQRQYRTLHRQLKRGFLTGKTENLVEQGMLIPAVVILLTKLQKL